MYVADRELLDFITHLQDQIEDLEEQRKLDELESARVFRSLAEHFLITLDTPEEWDGVRETLHEALKDMADQVARLEEHTL